jgi:arginase
MGKHLSVLFPQWQGGGIKATYEGAQCLKRDYLQGADYTEIEVEQDEALETEHGIVGYAPIMRQLTRLHDLIETERPDTLFVMGGGDDVDILPPAWCNALAKGDMAVAFFDAHGDLNSPATSPSGNLHGMPLRAMLGDTDPAIRDLMASTLDPDQVVMIGTRDCDQPELDYIAEHHMTVVRSEQVNADPSSVVSAIRAKGKRKLYIHVDIDVIDPGEFAWQPVPAADGVTEDAFVRTIEMLRQEFDVCGVCMLGYKRMPEERDRALATLVETGLAL